MSHADWNHESLGLLRLACVHGLGRVHARKLLDALATAEAVFREGPAFLDAAGEHAMAAALRKGPDDTNVARALRWREAAGHELLTWNSERYPGLLREIADPPLALYARGRIELLHAPAIAIVGSRNATAQGRSDAFQIARALSSAGLCVVSGLALGIDASAHAGALESAASSTAVLGTGIDQVYPAANRPLYRRLEVEGCLLTELPPGTPPLKGNFPVRNRLISGLARGVLVIEAAMQSGSLVTAKSALGQGREVFAMPGSIHSPLSRGCHSLLCQGAKLTETAEDVLSELGMACPAATPVARARPAKGSLLDFMGFAPISLEQLAAVSGFGVARTAEQLTRLELEGAVAILAGGLFQRMPHASARH